MIMILVGIAVVVFIVDILLKYSIEERLELNEERPVCGDKILIRRVHNKGACLNLFQTHPDKVLWTSVILGLAILVYDGILVSKKKFLLKKTAMMLFTGGAFSNICDRLFRGYVVDYIGLKTKWKKLTSITYNIGDFAIFAGSFLYCITEVFRKDI